MECKDCPYHEFGYVAPQLQKDSDILFVGQNPGKEELKAGIPFCPKGDSGDLLRRYLAELDTKGIKYSITNALKCGTPNNKTPTPKELKKCKHHLEADIAETTPKLIVALGKPALIALTGLNKSILKLNGKVLREYTPPILVCVHPSFIVRNAYKNIAIFEAGILPALSYFDKAQEIEVRTEVTVEPTEEEVGFDIETTSLLPHLGIIRCFSISDGDKAIFVEIEGDDDDKKV